MSEEKLEENIIDINVCDEMENSFLEYAYSVIYSRALPDARDGLKPVQRRILFQMKQMGLLPDKGHVKSAGVVGDVMGKLHPHGDSAIYDALVRMAQPFSLRLPLIDGHGNFGTLDDGPAAYRYTEARLAPPALELTNNLDENVVDFIPNYDNRYTQPEVLPASFPNLLVNGSSGIAVGMATNIAPHNLGECIKACIYLLDNPNATTEKIMEFIPGPDLPEGGIIIGLDGIKQAYETGKGSFKTRARTKIERITARKEGIIVDQLPYMVGPERVIEKIKEAVSSKKIQGITNVTNLTDRHNGLRLVIEIKNGFNPKAVLEMLFKYTPMEESFSMNNVCLVNGTPKTLGIKAILTVFLEHRINVVRRRTSFRLEKKKQRLHLVNGLLLAIADIDQVITVIRQSNDAQTAKNNLIEIFKLSNEQAEYILELKLRRLTKFSKIELEAEKNDLQEEIEHLCELLDDNKKLVKQVQKELQEVSDKYSSPRKTILIDENITIGIENTKDKISSKRTNNKIPLKFSDQPCKVILTSTGMIARITTNNNLYEGTLRTRNDAINTSISTTTLSEIGIITSDGNLHKIKVIDLVPLPYKDGVFSFDGAINANDFLEENLQSKAKVIGIIDLSNKSTTLIMATKNGMIKRMRPEYLENKEIFQIILLDAEDELIGVKHCDFSCEIVLISNQGQALRLSSDKIRPQGRLSRGVLGMKLEEGFNVIAMGVIPEEKIEISHVITVSASNSVLPGIEQIGVKTLPISEIPLKNRGGLGVRVQKFLKNEDYIEKAWVGVGIGKALTEKQVPIKLPEVDMKRTSSSKKITKKIAYIGS